jgi:hypothetical protein
MTRFGQRPGKYPALLLGVLGIWLLALPSMARADVITDVNTQLLNIIQNTSASWIDGPPEVANEIQMIDSAMFDAVNAASGGTLNAINYSGPMANANAQAAALSAALTVMNNLYVDPSTSLYQQYEGKTAGNYPALSSYAAGATVGPTTTQMAAVLADINNVSTELSALGNSTTISNGTAVGVSAGNAAIAANNASGSQAAMVATLTPYEATGTGSTPTTTTPGVYVSPGGRPALQPTWGTVAPVAMTSATLSALQATIPAPLTTNANGTPNPTGLNSTAYANQVLQVECQGSGTGLPSNVAAACAAAGFAPESAAAAQAALFWNDPGGTLQPPGHWLQIADTVTEAAGLDLLQTAQATALAGIAMNDAGIGVWGLKYQYNSWRPVTAIQACSSGVYSWNSTLTADDSCDTSWSSLIATPPHPDYLAGHPGFSGAAATVLGDVLSGDGVTLQPFVSTSNAYCNAGTATVDADGYIVSCTTGAGTFTVSASDCSGTPTYDSVGTVIGCTVDGTPVTMVGADCNNAGAVTVLNADYTLNPNYNSSPLICPIAETYDSLQQASSGDLGAEYSRVVGGIHTPDAVVEALALGNAIGNAVSEDEVPEPPMAPTLAASLLVLGALRHRYRSRNKADQAI